MSNAFDDVRAAVSLATFQLEAADSVASNMAELLRGRLRGVKRVATLKALKHELQDFNMQTGRWKALGRRKA